MLSVLKTKVLDDGDNQIHGFIYYDGYLWASTRTSPSRILKIDPDTLQYQKIVLSPDLNTGDDIIAAEGYIWVIIYTTPAKIVRVNPETLSWEVAVSFKRSEISRGGSLEYAFGHLWAGGAPGKIAKINVGNLTYQIYDYSTDVGTSQFHGLTSGGGYIWGSAPLFRSSLLGREFYADTIVRINPSQPSDYRTVYIDTPMSDDIMYIQDSLYTGGEKSPSYVYKISNNLALSSFKASETPSYGIFSGQSSIWSVHIGSPGKIVEFDSSLVIRGTYQLPLGFDDANELAFDGSGNIYVTCWQSPARIVKLGISASSPAPAPTLTPTPVPRPIPTPISTPPKPPQPLLPEMGVKVKSPIRFDWKDITDDSSPVTYTLQIATNKDFTASSIILEKTGLTNIEYILAEEEELKLSSTETPYYWRLKAIDAAQNESEWTGAGLFYFAEPFTFPGWIIYIICVFVVLLIAGFLLSSNLRKRRLLLEGKKAELIAMIDEALKEKKK